MTEESGEQIRKDEISDEELYSVLAQADSAPKLKNYWLNSNSEGQTIGWIDNERLYRHHLSIKILKKYKENNIKIKFRLKDRNEIGFSGNIKSIEEETEHFSSLLTIKNDVGTIFIPIIDIDSTTIMPESIQNTPIIRIERQTLPSGLRFDVLNRDNYTCQYCGRQSNEVKLEVDHIKPVANGGLNEINNLITSCIDCNRGKATKSIGFNA